MLIIGHGRHGPWSMTVTRFRVFTVPQVLVARVSGETSCEIQILSYHTCIQVNSSYIRRPGGSPQLNTTTVTVWELHRRSHHKGTTSKSRRDKARRNLKALPKLTFEFNYSS